jgi:Asp-tRNA(Asn)/Glu-tRNA(Gln) amidotransferase A subunit family amidase
MADDQPDRVPGVDPAVVASVADRLGIDADAADWTAAVDRVVDTVRALPTAEETPRATGVTAAADDHGALRHRFELPAGRGDRSARVAVKANLAVAGVPTDCGAAVSPVTPERTATAVERLRAAGADVVATTAMDELAYDVSGTTASRRVRNPAAPARVPGGSSAGSGAAVAAGLVEAALGSDTGGSVRIPASYCGVVGLKPTREAIPRAGLVDLAPTLDHVGVLADSVDTAARVFDTCRTPVHSSTPPSASERVQREVDPSGLRVAVVEEAVTGVDPAVRESVTGAVTAVSDAVETVERVSVPGWGHAGPALSLVVGAELAALVAAGGVVPGAAGGETGARLFGRLREADAYGANVRAGLLAHGGAVAATDGEAYARARAAGRAVADGVKHRLEAFDALVTPTTPTPPPVEVASPGALDPVTNTAPFNFSGHPAVSVPCGRVDGAPVGLQVAAGDGRERVALAVARRVAAAAG